MITGPVKFDFYTGNVKRSAMAFWCVMMKRELFDEIGLLDEIFSPGTGEDGDFCIKAEMAGHELVRVPEAGSHFFNSSESKGVWSQFPMYHAGSATFGALDAGSLIKHNKAILDQRYGQLSMKQYCIRPDYKTNPTIKYFDDTPSADEWQKEVYECARKLAADKGYKTILDIGCGSAYKLVTQFSESNFNTVGLDLAPTVAFLKQKYPNRTWAEYDIEKTIVLPSECKQSFDLVICSDVIEHVYDPDQLVKFIKSLSYKQIIFSTPAREILTSLNGKILGPPDNPCHIREWTSDEFKQYLSQNFTVEDSIISNVAQATQLVLASPRKVEVTIVIPTYSHFEDAFKPCIDAVLKYTNLKDKEVIVVANGCGNETRQYLLALQDRIKYVWFDDPQGYIKSVNAGIEKGTGKYTVLLDDDSILLTQPVDAWIDILKKPFLDNNMVGGTSPFAHEYENLGFVLHSGCTMYNSDLLKKIGMFDEIYHPGYFSDGDVAMKIWQAGYKCVEVPVHGANKEYENGVFSVNFPVYHSGLVQTMDKYKDWDIVQKNKAILYSRYGSKKMSIKYSIVIPTYNHCSDLLKPCLESIIKFTDLSNVEVIVVANGCVDETKEYVESLGPSFKLIFDPEPLGYTKATNVGIKAATGEYVVLLNNDTVLLGQEKNQWLNQLEAPFLRKQSVGLTGPLKLHDDYANYPVLIFFCVMVKRELFEKIGVLDEIFSPGGGEDIDFSIRAEQAGYTAEICDGGVHGDKINPNTGGFPIWHAENKTFSEIPIYTNWIVKRNGLLNCIRYNKNIKLNLGSGNQNIPGYLSVDLYDKRADVLMDARKLEFKDNSVVEIVASHLIEHLNPYHIESILREWRRVLKPGGRLVIEMPNIAELCKRFGPASKNERYGILNAIYGTVNTSGIGGPDNNVSPHLFGWWPASIEQYMILVGFTNIVIGPEQIPHVESNFRIEGVKSVAPDNIKSNIVDYEPFVPVPESSPEEIAAILATVDKIKLNVGSGGVPFPGYISVDLYDPRAQIHLDLDNLKLPENSVDEILGSHVFEHISPFKVTTVLANCFHVLKPGGKLALEMPDIETLCARFENADWGTRYGILNAIYGSVNTTTIGGQDNITSPHLFGWWPESLLDHLSSAGFTEIVFLPEQIPHPQSNLRVEAIKPLVQITPQLDRKRYAEQEPLTYQEIFTDDNYRMVETEIKGKTVIDVGANVGFFSLRCAEMGAKKIIAIEAQPTIYNFGLLVNVKGFPTIEPKNFAVLDVDGKTVNIKNYHVASRVTSGDGDPVQTVTLKTLIKDIPDTDMVLKLDCEGAEYDILLTADPGTIRKFQLVHIEIHADGHENPKYNDVSLVQNRLLSLGYNRVYANPLLWFKDVNGVIETSLTGTIVEKWVRV